MESVRSCPLRAPSNSLQRTTPEHIDHHSAICRTSLPALTLLLLLLVEHPSGLIIGSGATRANTSIVRVFWNTLALLPLLLLLLLQEHQLHLIVTQSAGGETTDWRHGREDGIICTSIVCGLCLTGPAMSAQ